MWVAITEKTPATGEEVLIVTVKGEIAVASYNGINSQDCWDVGRAINGYDSEIFDIVTHWQKLPAIPEKEELNVHKPLIRRTDICFVDDIKKKKVIRGDIGIVVKMNIGGRTMSVYHDNQDRILRDIPCNLVYVLNTL